MRIAMQVPVMEAQLKSPESGFTLIELLFSITLTLIVIGSFYELTSFIYRDYAGQIALAETRQASRAATTFFQTEIQNTGLDPKGTAFKFPQIAEPILEASETVFHFMGDKNGNGIFNQPDDTNEDVRYEWIGKECNGPCKPLRTPYTLYRKTGGEGGLQEVALGIQTFRLDYFDENGRHLPAGSLTKEDRIKIRKVVLMLRPLTKDSTQGKREWVSEIYLKNVG